jgi:hypothetical protein
MALHKFVFLIEDATNATFKCSVCLQILQFNKPAVGSPSPVRDVTGLLWLTPDAPDQWISPCLGVPTPGLT